MDAAFVGFIIPYQDQNAAGFGGSNYRLSLFFPAKGSGSVKYMYNTKCFDELSW